MMEDDPHPDFDFSGPGPQDLANGTAILAAALVREAQSLAGAAAGLRATLDLFAEAKAGDHGLVQAGTRDAALLSGALMLVARQLLRSIGEPAQAARHCVERLPRGALSVGEVVGHLRAAALAPVTDDGAARIAAATIAETFASAFEAAWQQAAPAIGGKGD
jgi:hypothetical protein